MAKIDFTPSFDFQEEQKPEDVTQIYRKEYEEQYLPTVKERMSRASIPGSEKWDKRPAMSYEEFAKRKDYKLKDLATSPLDIGASVLSGIATPIDAAIRAPLMTAIHGGSLVKNYEDIFTSDLYQPKTEYGQKALESVAPFLGALPPVGGYIGGLGKIRSKAKPIPIEERLAVLDTTSKSVEEPKPSTAMTPSQLKAWKETQDKFAAYKAEQEALAKQQAAQQALEARQRALEEDVARQGGLDRNAAERARQEAAPTGYDQWLEQQRQDANTRIPGNNESVKLPRQSRKIVAQDILNQRGLAEEPFRPDNMVEPDKILYPEQNTTPLEVQDILGRTQEPTLVDKVQQTLRQKETPEEMATRLALPVSVMDILNRPPNTVEKINIILNGGKERGAIDVKNIEDGLAKVFQFTPKIPVGEATELPIEHIEPVGSPKPILSVIQGGKKAERERGGIDLSQWGKDNKTLKKIEELTKSKFYAEKVNPTDVIAAALQHGKDSNGTVNLSAGATLEAAKRQSPLILGVGRTIQRALSIAEDQIRNTVFPVEKSFRNLSKQEIYDLGAVLKEEMFSRKTFDSTQLSQLLNEKQLLAYAKLRDAFRKTFEVQNKVREAQGLKPITELEAYVSSVWSGDYRSLVKDTNGKTVWALAAQTKWGLAQQKKALLKEFPGLNVEDFIVKSSKQGSTAQAMYTSMLDVLGRDDPAVKAMSTWMEDNLTGEARAFLNQEKHFEQKGNTRGFIGDRPNKLGKTSEAVDMVQAQIDYMKNAHQWSALQNAAQDIKTILNDKDLQTQQPNNVAYAREYWLNQLGANEHAITRAVEDWIRQSGVSPNAIYKVVGGAKNLWTTKQLALNAGFILTNGMQMASMIPHLSDMQVKYGGNPALAVSSGLTLGPLLATGHVFSNRLAKSPEALYKAIGLSGLPEETTMFLVQAMKYAEDNSIVSRSVYDESPIASSFGAYNNVMKALGKTITLPETYLRGITYMTYVTQLKSSGKFSNPMDIFRIADERTNMSMGDYRTGERAPIFNKMGTAGNALSTLTTFPINYYNQWSWAAREGFRGNPLPAIAMLGVGMYLSGLMGVPGFSDADKLVEQSKEWLSQANPLAWSKVRNVGLKDLALQAPMGATMVYGGLSEQSGISFTARAAAPSPFEMSQTPGAPMADLAKNVWEIGDAATSGFMDNQKNAQALHNAAPAGLQGMLETGMLRDQYSVPSQNGRIYQSQKLADRKGMYERTPGEEALRAKGFKSQKEAVTRDLQWRLDRRKAIEGNVLRDIPNRLYNEIRKGNMEKAKDYIILYAELSGKGISKEMLRNQIMQEFTTASQRNWTGKKLPVDMMIEVKKMDKLLTDMGYKNGM